MSGFTSRRKFLVGATLGIAGSVLAVNHLRSQIKVNPAAQPTHSALRSIIDTIIPQDHTPGALSLNIDQKIEQLMRSKPTFQALVTRLLASVMKKSLSKHRQSFETLGIDQREMLLLEMLERDSPQRARLDLQQLRQEIMKVYYTSPQGQQSINYIAPNRYPAYSSVS